MFKKIIMILVVSIICFNISNVVNAQTKEKDKENVIYNAEKLEAYSNYFNELELELNNKYATDISLYNVSTKKIKDSNNYIRMTVNEDNALITLGILYKEVPTMNTKSSDGTDITTYITCGKVYLRSEFSVSGDSVSLDHIEGELLATYDGFQFKSINVEAGQTSIFDPSSVRTDSFSTSKKSYSKNYNWPLSPYTDYDAVGQTATFKFRDPVYGGSVSSDVSCNY